MSGKSVASGGSGSTVKSSKTNKSENSVTSLTSSKSSNKSKSLSEIAKKSSCHVNLERMPTKTEHSQEVVPTNENGHTSQNKDNTKKDKLPERKGRIPQPQGEKLYQYAEVLIQDKSEEFILDQMFRHLTRKERGSTDQAKLYRKCLEDRIKNLQNSEYKEKKDQENLIKEVVRLFDEQRDKLLELQKQLKANDKTKMKTIIEESTELKNTVEVIIKTNQEIILNQHQRLQGIEKRQLENYNELMETMEHRLTLIQENMENRLLQHTININEKYQKERPEDTQNQRHREEAPSYADTVNFPALPVENPKIVIKARDQKTTMQEIKKSLNTINMRELPSVNCLEMRQKQLIITCKNRNAIEMVKEKIEQKEDLVGKIDILEPRQRQARIIIFGAPEAPELKKPTSAENENTDDDTESELYDQQILRPALQKAARTMDIEYKLIKVIKGRIGEGSSHLVIQLPEVQAIRLLSTKFTIGFNRCTAKRYITILRCYNCQQYGHTARSCRNDEACARCGKKHNIRDCESTRADCVNCRLVLNQYGGNYRLAGVQTQHPAYDPQCSCYQKRKSDALKSLNKTVTYDVTCSAKQMKVTIMISNNQSYIYVQNFRGFKGCTPKTVDGKTTIKLPLDNFHMCGTSRMLNKYTSQSLYYNRIIIDYADKPREVILVKCVLPFDKTKTATLDKRVKRDVLPEGFFEADDLNITTIVAHAPTPYLTLAIRQNGKFLAPDANVQPGAALEMLIYLDEKSSSTYGLLASYLKVTDGTPEHDEVIVMNGCAIDPYIFGNFQTTDGGKTLFSKFRAFKFPDSNYVLFVGTVNVCLKQCRGVQCGTDHLGFGRKKREIPAEMPFDPNKLFDVEMTTAIRINFAPDHFEPIRSSVVGTYDGIRAPEESFKTNDEVSFEVINAASSLHPSHILGLFLLLLPILVRIH